VLRAQIRQMSTSLLELERLVGKMGAVAVVSAAMQLEPLAMGLATAVRMGEFAVRATREEADPGPVEAISGVSSC
jgi:hypothetical protein